MKTARSDFIDFLLKSNALRFGDFVTKSGRPSPYFINTGMFKTGEQITRLGQFYAQAIQERFPSSVDHLYGPAYKGIPLVVSTASALFTLYNRDVGVTFNRKESKSHGEGGSLIGALYDSPAEIVVVEDVITAGTAIGETMELLSHYPNAHVVGLLVSVDRKERLGDDSRSALQMIQEKYKLQAASLIDINDLISALSEESFRERYSISSSQLEKMLEYRHRYGADE